MLITLIRRELLDNLMTFRFAAAVFITLLLVVANTAVLIQDYERRLAAYNTALKTHQDKLQEFKAYSGYELNIDRPPNPLSIFNAGFDKQLGNQVPIYHAFVPTLWDASMHGSDNPFLNIFTSIDIVFIFEVILSLTALLFAYDAFAGERERGTLRLVLAQSVRRGHILLAKYISAMLCLLMPLLLSLLFAMILLTNNRSLSLSPDDFLRIGGIVLTSLVYLSVFYLIGMLISEVSRRTSTALMLSMFAWGFLVLVYPNMILAVMSPSSPPRAQIDSTANQMKQIWEEFDRERKDFLVNDPVPGESMWFGIGASGWSSEYLIQRTSKLNVYLKNTLNIGKINEQSESQVPHAQGYFRFLEPRVIGNAEKTWLLRKPGLENIFVRPAGIDKTLLKLSPMGIYDSATQAWTGTDLNGIRDFFDAARQYRQRVINYFYDKEAFGEQQWFSANQGAVDWSRLPQFRFKRSDIGVNTKRALPDVCLLLLINVILFMAIFLIFIKSEV
ncbi:MAG: ABC transporter permease subunit [Candidatus Poribacteria bacterium]|nr:ABC transporter permease subunit [Candidatus Poribacteria bacterium]